MCRKLRLEARKGADLYKSVGYISFMVIAFFLGSATFAHGQLSLSFSTTNPNCAGLPNGQITVVPSGGTAPYNYSWNTGATTATIDGLVAGTYSVTVTDDAGTSVSGSATLEDPDQLEVVFDTDECQEPYSISASASGGVGPYTYRWGTGDVGETISVDESGKYCVTVTDANLCGRLACVTVTFNPPSVDVITNDITCAGENDGTMVADVSGGQAPFTYQWSNGANTASVSNLAPGTYTVTVTDDKGCTAVASGTVADQAPIIINTTSDNPDCADDTNGSATASASGGTPGYTYLWSTGATTPTITNLGPGTYTVTVTDANGCDEEESVTLVTESNIAVTASATDEVCPEEADGTMTAQASGGVSPYTYSWSNGATTSVVSGVAPGTYTVTVTDDLGCTATATVTIDAAPDFVIDTEKTDVTTCDAADGTATVTVLSGAGPYTYLWNNGQTSSTISGLAAGTYVVTVTNVDGCEAIGLVGITEPPAIGITIDATASVCEGERDGIATVVIQGGTAPFDIDWSTGDETETISELAAGSYSVTVTDANGCTDSGSITINQNDAPEIIVDGTEIVCGGENIGTANVQISGGQAPYAVMWSNGSTSENLENLGSGDYGVTVTDANGCTATGSVTVEVVEEILLDLTVRNLLCNDDNSGGASLTIDGGNAPYQVLWNTGETSQQLTGVPAGTYSVSVTDANDCTATANFSISEPSALSGSIDASAVVCPGDNSGTATVTISGGTVPYTYLWSNGATTRTINDITAGTYSVQVTDDNGCTLTVSTVIEEAPGVAATVTTSGMSCGGANVGTAEVNVSAGTAPYSYLWNTGATTQSINGLGTGTYTVTVTDANGCTTVASGEVMINSTINLDIEGRDVLCNGDANGGALATVTGGTTPYTYAWNTGATTADLVGVVAGTYTLVVTDAMGCTAQGSVTINQPAPLSGSIDASDIVCAGDETGTATVSISGGTAPYAYLWNNEATTATINDLTAGSYSVQVTDDNGCTITVSVVIEEAPVVTAAVTTSGVSCGGGNVGTAEVTVSSGVAPYTYLWSTGATTQSISGLGSGTYTVTVTDDNGCTTVASGEVMINSEISVSIAGRDALCNGDANGGATATVTGGTAPYTYAWSNGASTADLTGVDAGTYTLTVTDAMGCTAQGSVTINQPTALFVEEAASNLDCGQPATGAAELTVDGGTAPYSYSWSNGATTAVIGNLDEGSYDYTVTDANGCTVSGSVEIQDLGAPICTINITKAVSNPMANDGAADVSVQGGVGPYTFAWNDGGSGQSRDDLGNQTYEVTVTDANGCTSSCSISPTVENALVGDYVWFDEDRDGIQDPGEEGIENIKVVITYLGEDETIEPDTMLTDADGKYLFEVAPGTYKITFCIPDSLTITMPNTGTDDTVDSDAMRDTYMTEPFTIENGEVDLTHDAGVVERPVATIENACTCLNNATRQGDGQFQETIKLVNGMVGDTWTIIDLTGAYTTASPAPPANPVAIPVGTALTPNGTGMFSYELRHIDQLGYTVTITNGVDTLKLGNKCDYPEITVSNLPEDLSFCINEAPLTLDIATSIPGTATVYLNGSVVTEIDPAALGVGNHELRIVLEPTDDEECESVFVSPIRVVTDGCPAKLGDTVWLDADKDGIQDPGEEGVAGVKVTLTKIENGTATDIDMATTDANGMYMFMVMPGDYKLTFDIDPDYAVTTQDAGADDALDSDVDPMTLMTPVYTITGGDMNMTIDAGIYIVCDNVDDPGMIGYDQMFCGPGFTPDKLIETKPATGGSGELQYLWMKSTKNVNFNNTDFQPIPNSDTPMYQPESVTATTYYARCVRREGCPYKETNIVEVFVKDEAKADLLGGTVVCAFEPAVFRADTKTDNASIKWAFSGNLTASATTGREVTVNFNSFGIYTIRLTVTENGCTATKTHRIVVTESPTYCGGNNALELNLESLSDQEEVMVKWRTVNDGLDYTFNVQHSNDGTAYSKIGEVNTPQRINGGFNYYEYTHNTPKPGRNYYRVEIIDQAANTAFSEVATLLMKDDKAQLMMIYPNPVDQQLTVEFMEEAEQQEVELELVTPGGAVMQRMKLSPGATQQRLDFTNMPEGMYFLRVTTGDDNSEVLKVFKRNQ